MRYVICALLVCLLGTLASGPAEAAPDARQSFIDGTKLYKEGETAAALEKFREALEASGSPNARLYVGRCLKDLGRNAEAYIEMQKTLEEASERADTDRKYAKTRDAAASQMALIERKIGKIIIALVGGDDETTVTVDDEELSPDKIGVPLPFDPKKITLRAESPNKVAAEREIEVYAGKTMTVTLQLKAPDEGGTGTGGGTTSGGGTGTATGGDTGVDTGGLNGVQIAGIVVTGLGVAGMVVYGVTGTMALDRRDMLEEECAGTYCIDAKYQDTIDEGEMFKLIANIGFGVGVAGILGGVALITIGTLSDDDAEAAKNATVRVSPGGGYVGYTWHF